MWNIEQGSYCVDILLIEFMNSMNSQNNRDNDELNMPEVLYPVNIS